MTVLTCYLANSVVDWAGIKALIANRLITALEAGVCPIGIGESILRVIGKTINGHCD